MLNLEDYLFSSQEYYNPIELDSNTISFPTKVNAYKSDTYQDRFQDTHLITPTDIIFDDNEDKILESNFKESPVTLPSSSHTGDFTNELNYCAVGNNNSNTNSRSSIISTNTLNIFDYSQGDTESPFNVTDSTNYESKCPSYVKQPRQSRYNTTKDMLTTSGRNIQIRKNNYNLENINEYNDGDKYPHKKVSDSRLSAHGLAEVLQLDSPEEALERERNILDIFENELHYPLGYKTWVRDTKKEKRIKLINELYSRVNARYPNYNYSLSILETIIRRATYYMMQSRLRRERRAKKKDIKEKRTIQLV